MKTFIIFFLFAISVSSVSAGDRGRMFGNGYNNYPSPVRSYGRDIYGYGGMDSQCNPSRVSTSVAGAAVGAALGALLDSNDRGRGAGRGAVGGGVVGYLSGAQCRERLAQQAPVTDFYCERQWDGRTGQWVVTNCTETVRQTNFGNRGQPMRDPGWIPR